jgi:hypothetical protein
MSPFLKKGTFFTFEGLHEDCVSNYQVAKDDLASRLAFREGGMGMCKRFFTGLDQLARRIGPMLD